MDKERFGRCLRKIREERGLTREQLAGDICSPKFIYNIETGKYFPSPLIIEGLSNTLSVDLYERMKNSEYKNPEEVLEIKEKLQELYLRAGIRKMGPYIERAKELSDFENDFDRQILLWYDAIYNSVLDKDYAKARKSLNEALLVTNELIINDINSATFITRWELRIVMSIANTYLFETNYKRVMEIYKLILPIFNKFYKDTREYYAFIYNFAYLHDRLKQPKKSLACIHYLKKRYPQITDLNLISDITYLEAKYYADKGDKTLAKKLFTKFAFLKETATDNKTHLYQYIESIHRRFDIEIQI